MKREDLLRLMDAWGAHPFVIDDHPLLGSFVEWAQREAAQKAVANLLRDMKQAAPGTYPAHRHYHLPDALYGGSKDWRQGDYADRVAWLHLMYEAVKRERDTLLQQLAQEPVGFINAQDAEALEAGAVGGLVTLTPVEDALHSQAVYTAPANTAPVARPRSEWTAADGAVLWWHFPDPDQPHFGTPTDENNWPEYFGDVPEGYYTHWTPVFTPAAPSGVGTRG